MTEPARNAIDRREAIRRAAALLGGALGAPAVAGVLAGCETRRTTFTGDWAPRAMSAEQGEMVAAIAEHIIPETDTPGARAVGVHRFIDTMLAEYYPADERRRFLDGLADVDARARKAVGQRFLRCQPAEQLRVLEQLDAETFAAPAQQQPPRPDPSKQTERGESATPPGDLRPDTTRRAAPAAAPAPAPFFRTMKELTLLGYYTSEAGATRELRYVQVPGRYEGCVPLTPDARAWAL